MSKPIHLADPQALRSRFFDGEEGLLETWVAAALEEGGEAVVPICDLLLEIDPKRALTAFATLLRGGDMDSRCRVMVALDGVAADKGPLLLELLSYPSADVQHYALRALGRCKAAAAVGAIAALSDRSDDEVAAAAFAALSAIDTPEAYNAVFPFAKDADPKRRILALVALGRMSCLRRWKALLPALESDEAEVRRTAVWSISAQGGVRARRQMRAALKEETDDGVKLQLMVELCRDGDEESVQGLVGIAAGHADSTLARRADWILSELDVEVVGPALLAHLERGGEATKVYVLEKIGRMGLSECAASVADRLEEGQAKRVLCAALGCLAQLGDRDYLAKVVEYLDSDDPMVAYVAARAATQLIQRLGECLPLGRLFETPDGTATAAKQGILQIVLDSFEWDFDDPLLHVVLRQCLQSGHQRIRRLAIQLMGRCRGQSHLAIDLEWAWANGDADQRGVARRALDQLLGGDLSVFLDILAAGGKVVRVRRCLEILGQLRWNLASARRGVEVLSGLDDKEPFRQALAEISELLFGLYPGVCCACFDRGVAGDHWRRSLGVAWAARLAADGNPMDRARWERLLDDEDDLVAAAALQHLEKKNPPWALGRLIARVGHWPEHRYTPGWRQAVRRMTSL